MRVTDYFLGAGPHAATRVEHPAGTVEIRMFNGLIVGHGNSAAEAAVHLAEQLRMIAQLVEAHEGVPTEPRRRGRHTVAIGLGGSGFRAFCSCGWCSATSRTRDDVVVAWEDHKRQVTPKASQEDDR